MLRCWSAIARVSLSGVYAGVVFLLGGRGAVGKPLARRESKAECVHPRLEHQNVHFELKCLARPRKLVAI